MFKGSFVSLITPFNQKLEIDYKRFRALIQWHLFHKTSGFVLGSSVGEGAFISLDEKILLLKETLNASEYKATVLFYVFEKNIGEAFSFLKRIQEEGADGAVIPYSFFNGLQEGEIFNALYHLTKAQLPLLIHYEGGARAGFLAELLALPLIAGIKDSSNSTALVQELLKKTAGSVFSAREGLLYLLVQKGAAGAFSFTANLCPSSWNSLVFSCLNQEEEKALFLHKKHQVLSDLLSVQPSPFLIKYSLSLLNKCEPYVRCKAVELDEKTKATLKLELQKLSKT